MELYNVHKQKDRKMVRKRQTDGQIEIDRWLDRDRQMVRQIDRQMVRQIDRLLDILGRINGFKEF